MIYFYQPLSIGFPILLPLPPVPVEEKVTHTKMKYISSVQTMSYVKVDWFQRWKSIAPLNSLTDGSSNRITNN